MLIITAWVWPPLMASERFFPVEADRKLQWSLFKKLGHSEVQPEFAAAAVSQARGTSAWFVCRKGLSREAPGNPGA